MLYQYLPPPCSGMITIVPSSAESWSFLSFYGITILGNLSWQMWILQQLWMLQLWLCVGGCAWMSNVMVSILFGQNQASHDNNGC